MESGEKIVDMAAAEAGKEKPTTVPELEDEELDLSKAPSVAPGELIQLDATEIFLRENHITNEYVQELLEDEALNKRLVRKIDLMILPLLAGTYLLQYIDKQALSYAAVFDLFTDAGISQTQYSWFASIFYFAYLAAEYPWVYVAQKTLMAKVVSGCIIVWGAILMITAACNNFGGLAACRFLLGVFEAPITTCFMLIVSMWYTRQQQPFRAGVFYCCNGVGAMVGGILTYAIGQINGFPVWKAVFLLCGGLTVVWGTLVALFLPDSVVSARRFSLDEKVLLIGRGRLARTGILNQTIKWYQIREAFTDLQVWLLVLFMLLNETVNGGIANFGKLIIKGVVTDPLQTVALGIPMGAFQVVWILSGTFLASRVRNCRTVVMAVYLVPTILGTCLMWKLDRKEHKVGVLFGYYIVGAFVCSLVLALQMPASNLGGYTKRVTASAMVFLAYCAGNIIGPHAFLSEEAPLYQTGCKLILACSATQMVVAIALRLLLVRRNKQRDRAAIANDITAEDTTAMDGTDLTDFENPHFRYVL
ncbi:Major facilitator superfamily transporter [Pleurostoma richardsiae]|uniref:Major facilitator superfamily transporter n=1 Tax=Pleurostoma richardsiae TaxID=41990 RepID=A0AA38RFH2_9PEZI|nr:Major facilitator superfamily transporter [Pleurostoma richardsiae]